MPATEEPIEEPTGFASLGLRPEILDALESLGYAEPTPIQAATIPLLLAGGDVLGQAATGTGKTAAFALPIVNSIDDPRPGVPVALILVPTRELAIQVSEAIEQYGRSQAVKVLAVYGGQPIGRQLHALNRGVHVVVATPGRALDHLRRGSLFLSSIETVVLDEADEMLDMGFTEDIEEILDATPGTQQTVLFSATMPPRIKSIANRYQTDPEHIKIGGGSSTPATELITQTVTFVERRYKAAALGRMLDLESPGSALVFCRTRDEVDDLTERLTVRGYRAEALHGGLNQQQRDRVMARLREGTAQLLIATDVAARGLDVDALTHVFNYDVPVAAESYVHRIGRVGRAGREGTAITLAEPKQRRLVKNIERLTKQKMQVRKVPTVEDLRAKQMARTTDAVREAMSADDLDRYEPILRHLTDNAPAPDDSPDNSEPETYRAAALAAIKLVHSQQAAQVDDTYIPDANAKDGPKKDRHRNRTDRGERNNERGQNKNSDGRDARGGKKGHRGAEADTGFVYVGLGRKAGVRPGDLVGAIANESGLSGRQIGPIKISDHYSVVGVPDREVDNVIRSIGKASVRGKRMKVRRYVE